MALIALKWDKDFIRVAVATNARGGSRVQFDRAQSIELAGDTEELSPAKLGDKLRAILERLGVQRGEATVIVARSDVEMRQFQLPPVPPDELPDMVRFQARNHFTTFNEESLIDFVPLETDEEHCTVLAAALSGEDVQKIRETVEAAGLKLRHIVVRPFAAAELVRAARPGNHCRVVLEIIGQEADLSVIENDFVLMSRTVRVPESYTVDQFDTWLPGEIRRTITAAGGQAGAGDVSEIIVCGNESEHKKLAEELKEKFSFDINFLPPFDLINKSGRFEQPTHDDGFASLLGSLVQSTSEENHALDFLNPRKKPEKTLDRRKIYTGVGVAASVILLGLFFVWWLLGNKDAQIAKLKEDIAGIRQFTDITDVTLADTLPLDDWKSKENNWLEELHCLSEILPEPESTRLGRFSGNDGIGTGNISVRGLLKDATMRDLIARLESRPYSVNPNDDPTNEGGFEREYRIGLQFPNSQIGPHGEVLRQDAPSGESANGESAPETQPTDQNNEAG